MQSRPLTQYIGEMVENKHLSNLNDNELADLKRLLFYRKAVFFENQFLSKKQIAELGHRLKSTPSSEVFEQDIDYTQTYHYGSSWHSDCEYKTTPPAYTIFQITKLPNNSFAGATEFTDMASLYKHGISDELKNLLKKLTATHEHISLKKLLFETPEGDNVMGKRVFTSVHPVVFNTTYDNTTVESLFISPAHTTKINNLLGEESSAILDALFKKIYFYTEYHYIHYWKEGSVVIWNNRLCSHRGLKDFLPEDVRLAMRAVVY
jgi:sulfonate dioxygenase